MAPPRRPIFLQPIDCATGEGLVRLTPSLLDDFDCQTSLRLRHDPPTYLDSNGAAVYETWMRRDLAIAFVQTLTSRRMCFSLNIVSFAELQEALQFEGGFSLSSSSSKREAESAVLKGPPLRPGLLNRKRKLEDRDEVKRVLASSATAIASWARLQHGLEYHSQKTQACKSPNFQCSATRCLIKVLNPPEKLIEPTGDAIYEISTTRPTWLVSLLTSFAVLRNELVESDAHSKADFSSFAFSLLQRKVASDPTGSFVCVLGDMPKCCRSYSSPCCIYRQRPVSVHSFPEDVLHAVVQHGSTLQSSGQSAEGAMTERVKYARALVGMAIKTVKTAPRLASLLSSINSHLPKSYEQCKFEAYLSKHGVDVVSWNPSVDCKLSCSSNPLLFPPSLKNIVTCQSRTPSVSVLIDVR